MAFPRNGLPRRIWHEADGLRGEADGAGRIRPRRQPRKRRGLALGCGLSPADSATGRRARRIAHAWVIAGTERASSRRCHDPAARSLQGARQGRPRRALDGTRSRLALPQTASAPASGNMMRYRGQLVLRRTAASPWASSGADQGLNEECGSGAIKMRLRFCRDTISNACWTRSGVQVPSARNERRRPRAKTLAKRPRINAGKRPGRVARPPFSSWGSRWSGDVGARVPRLRALVWTGFPSFGLPRQTVGN